MKRLHQFLALLLCIALLAGFVPATARAADETLNLNADTVARQGKWEEFKTKVEQAQAGTTVTITVQDSVALPEPLVNANGANFYIKGAAAGSKPSISPNGSFTQENALFMFSGGNEHSTLYVKNVTLNGGKKTGLLQVSGYEFVQLGSDPNPGGELDTTQGCVFRNGNVMRYSAVHLNNIGRGRINCCKFTDNEGDPGYATTGCLYIVTTDRTNGMYINQTTFSGNIGHSGGALYAFGQDCYVYIGPKCKFTDNTANQRGGAILCHATVYVDGATFDGNNSGQYGGTFYVSTQETPTSGHGTQRYYGTMALNGWPDKPTGTTISGSHALTAGGAGFVNENGTLVLMGKLNIQDNTIGREGHTEPNNIYTAADSGHIVAMKSFFDLTTGDNRVGISTSNGYQGKNMVISPKSLIDDWGYNWEGDISEYPNYALLIAHLNNDASGEYFDDEIANYSFADREDAPERFTYDGGLFKLVHNPDKPDMLMLDYQMDLASPTLIFDYNLPGAAATVYPSADTRNGYRFTGWYLDKTCTIPLVSGTPVRGSATYYAGWTEKEHLVTWDTGYSGGPIFVTGQNHGEKLDIVTGPTREGYTFGGWYTEKRGQGTRAEAYP